MTVYWFEQTEADVPAEDNWLGIEELERLWSFRIPKRRADWRLGRWTAKRAVTLCLNLPDSLPTLASIEIRPAPSGAPEVFLSGERCQIAISLTHRGGIGACAVSLDQAVLGCDLEIVEPHSDAFVADYFTPEEQVFINHAAGADRAVITALLWSAKESALKLLHAGLRLDTRCVTANVCGFSEARAQDQWQPLQVRHSEGELFCGWWQQIANTVRTLVATPPPERPMVLTVGR